MEAFPDKSEIHRHGSLLRAVADDAASAAARLEHRVSAAHLRGPAADRLRASVSEHSGRLRQIAADLRDLADIVHQGAAQ